MMTDLNDTYNMMIMMTMVMMRRRMKIKNGHNSANFEATTSRFSMVIDINDTYRLYFQVKS